MKKILVCLMVSLALASFLSAQLPGPGSSRVMGAPLAKTSKDGKFHLLRIQQLGDLPKGATVGVLSAGASTMSLFLEADLESVGLKVRQIDVYGLLSPRQLEMTDPGRDFIFTNRLVELVPLVTKESVPPLADKLVNQDNLTVENQLVDHYKSLNSNLRDLIKLMNVNYLVVVSPVFQELSYSLKIYDSSSFDLIYTCMFAGGIEEWRNIVGQPNKNPANLSYNFVAASEPNAFWEMAFSAFAVKNLKVGGVSAGAPANGKP